MGGGYEPKHGDYWFTWWLIWHSRALSPVPSVHLKHTFISDPLLPLEVCLNPAMLATCLCLLLPEHLSTCPSASLTSCFGPADPPFSSPSQGDKWCSVTRQALQRPGAAYRKVPVINRGGGGTEAGWKMSSFTGKSCEPRNISSGSITPPSFTFPPHPPSLSVGARWGFVCVGVGVLV